MFLIFLYIKKIIIEIICKKSYFYRYIKVYLYVEVVFLPFFHLIHPVFLEEEFS